MHKFLSCVRFGCWTQLPPPSLLRALLGSSFHIILMNTGPGWASKLFVMSHIIVFSSAHLEISHFTAKPKPFFENIIGCAVAESRFLFIQLEGQISPSVEEGHRKYAEVESSLQLVKVCQMTRVGAGNTERSWTQLFAVSTHFVKLVEKQEHLP